MRSKLKYLGIVSTGNTPSKSNEAFYDSDDIGFVKPDIFLDCSITEKIVVSEYISENARSKARIVKDGAVFVTCIGTIGKVGVADGEYAFNQQINAIQPNEKVSSKYLAYCMLYNKKALQAIANAPVVPIINKSQFEEFELEIEEDTNEQKRIVEILDKVNGVLESRKRELQELDDLIKSRFVEMFGDVIVNDKQWEVFEWSQVLIIINGKNQKDVESDRGSYLICGSGGPMGKANDFLVQENSVIIGRKGNINKPILMREKFWNVDTAFGLEPNTDKMLVEYLYYFCEFFDFERLNKAVTIPSLTKADLLKIEIPLPNIKLQEQFASFVHQVDKLKSAS